MLLSHKTSINLSITAKSIHATKSIPTTTTTPSGKGGGRFIGEEEEDLAEEEAKLYAITIGSWVIMLDIAKSLQRHVHIAKCRIIMWNNVPS